MARIQQIIPCLAVIVALSGCGRPEDPGFTYQEGTEQLVPEVSEAVQALVVDSFGTPYHPVAWQKMPVDFGTLAGTVTGVVQEGAGQGSYRIQVEFEPAAGGESEETDEAEIDEAQDEDAADSPALPPEYINFTGLGLVWKSGTYAGGGEVESGRREGEGVYSLNVAAFDRQTSILTLQQRLDPPPQPGDTFEVVGHKLAAGRQLYATNCQHCHGISGDGDGPTAKYLSPRPRDYRLGTFKFKSTIRATRPTDDDLKRIVSKGIPGTYMPSFLLLQDHELEAIVQYVKYLSMRGEYELALVNLMSGDFGQEAFAERVDETLAEAEQAGGDVPSRGDVREQILNDEGRDFVRLAELANVEAEFIASLWLDAQKPESVVIPPVARVADTYQSRVKGRELYIQNCAVCHGATGRGDGEQVEAYSKNETTQQNYPEPGLYDDWGQPIEPRDLTRGIYRGGRRPVDIYRRIHEGINGTPMISFKQKIPDADMWHLVNYVYSIPFGGIEGEHPGAAAESTASEVNAAEAATVASDTKPRESVTE